MGRDISFTHRTSMTVERWHRMLDDESERRDLPRLYRENLIEAADDMLRAGIIDPLEHFDLLELAESAYSHEIEEQIVRHRYFLRSGSYVLVRDGAALGYLSGTAFNWKPPEKRWSASQIDARVTHTDIGLELLNRSEESIGFIDGKRCITPTGEYELVEVSRMIRGIELRAIDDPDLYRAALDAIQLAKEEGDTERHAAISTRASVSIFMPCPVCDDSFSKREDCAECEGRGFVRETPERFRWRS